MDEKAKKREERLRSMLEALPPEQKAFLEYLKRTPPRPMTMDDYRLIEEALNDPERIARWEEGRAEREAYRMPQSEPEEEQAAPAKEQKENEKHKL